MTPKMIDMTSKAIVVALTITFMFGCGTTESVSEPPPVQVGAAGEAGAAGEGGEGGNIDVPTVRSAPIYEDSIEISTHIYGHAQVHTDWMEPVHVNSREPDVNDGIIDLRLDVYEPLDAPPNRPAILIVHGGGFTGGTRDKDSCVNFANYFAARGFVAVSISYRLVKHRGTIPQSWFDVFAALDITDDARDQGLAIYPAARDAKAAIRWLHANADRFGINSNFITSTGGSAGSQLAIVLGVTDPTDFRDELTTQADPTLLSTHLETRADVHTIVEHWGGTTAMRILEAIDGQNRFDETDPPMSIVHGTADETVFFTEAEQLRDQYIRTGVAYAYHPLEGKGHGAWNSKVLVDGIETRLEPLAFEFVRQQQGLDLAP